jgi:AraC-type transcriptional regulator N-terminus
MTAWLHLPTSPPVIAHISRASADEPFLAFVLKLRPERIAALLLETVPAATARPGPVDATPHGIAVSDASPALLDATRPAARAARHARRRRCQVP